MAKSKISDNPSFKKLKEQFEGTQAFLQLSKALASFGLSSLPVEEAFKDLPSLLTEFEKLSTGPDKFNEYFSTRGWVAHESINTDLMFEAIDLAQKKQIDLAEQMLAKFYNSEDLKFLIYPFKGIAGFSTRYPLFLLAYEDTLEERYHASVPVLLMMIDGIVTDITKTTGFFTETSDLTAWDSIAAHSSGLTQLRTIFNLGRNKTQTDEITLPYRNGILHGRDLGYANKMVNGKCWAAVFAIYDWVKALQQKKKPDPNIDTELSPQDALLSMVNELKKYREVMTYNNKVKRVLAEWKPKIIVIGSDVPKTGSSSDYENGSPEQEAVQFIEYWKNKKYGIVAQQIAKLSESSPPLNNKKKAGEVRTALEGKQPGDFKILKIVECTSCITEVTLSLTIKFEDKEEVVTLTLRMIYQTANGKPLIYKFEEGGKWYFLESILSTIRYENWDIQ